MSKHTLLRGGTVGSVLWLAAVWVLLWGNLSWANVISGLLLAVFVLWVFPLPTQRARVGFRPVSFAWLVLRFQWDLIRASIAVAWKALWPGARTPPGSLLQVQLRSRSPWQQTLVAELTALVPGTLVIDIDRVAGIITLHALGAQTGADARRIRDMVLAQEARVMAALPARAHRPLSRGRPQSERQASADPPGGEA